MYVVKRDGHKEPVMFDTLSMETILDIMPGPKPKKSDGTIDKRRRVNPINKPKHKPLKIHIHKPND